MDCSSIIPKKDPKQQKLRMNWCKSKKDRNNYNIMFSDEWIFNLKVSAGVSWWWKWALCSVKDQVYSYD